MIDIEEYLKERNIPTDSLEANSIREGAELMKNKIVESLDKVVTDALDYDTDDLEDQKDVEKTIAESLVGKEGRITYYQPKTKRNEKKLTKRIIK